MFRRAGDKVYAAIFVYRVKSLQAEPQWAVQASSAGGLQIPWMLDLESGDNAYEPWRVGQGSGYPEDRDQWILPNADAGDQYDPMSSDDCWQCPGQWLVDQNGLVNRVAIGRSRRNDPSTHVELEHAVPPLAEDSVHIPDSGETGFAHDVDHRVPMTGSIILPAGARADGNFVYSRGMIVGDQEADLVIGGPVVSRLWYMPPGAMNSDGDEWGFTPVYILVEEL
jgi:hypothetical protein